MRFPYHLESDSFGDDATDAGLEAVANCQVSAKQYLPEATFFQCDDIQVSELMFDPGVDGQGGMWMYRTGDCDPVEFSAHALACGASSILSDQLLPCPLPQAIVSDVDEAACRLLTQIYQTPNQRLLTIGVVGNAGKTTTALLVASVLRSMGLRTAYETDLGYCDGLVQSVAPEPNAKGAKLMQRMADACDADCSAIVIEWSDELAATHSGIQWDLLVVTGNGRMADAHSDQHRFGPDAMDEALDHLAGDGVVLVSADEPKLVRRVDDRGCKRLTYGVRRSADISAKIVEHQLGEMTLMVSCGVESVAMDTKLCGEAMALNQLAAISVAMLLEAPLVQAVQLASHAPSIPGRMQAMHSGNGTPIVVDAAGDHQRLAATLRALRQQRLPGGKLWCILTLDADSMQSSEMDRMHCGRVMERLADHIVLTSTPEAKTSFLNSAHQVIDGFKRVAAARLVANQTQAIRWAMAHARPQDLILVVGGLDGATAKDRRLAIQRLQNEIQRCQTLEESDEQAPKILPLPWVKTQV